MLTIFRRRVLPNDNYLAFPDQALSNPASLPPYFAPSLSSEQSDVSHPTTSLPPAASQEGSVENDLPVATTNPHT